MIDSDDEIGEISEGNNVFELLPNIQVSLFGGDDGVSSLLAVVQNKGSLVARPFTVSFQAMHPDGWRDLVGGKQRQTSPLEPGVSAVLAPPLLSRVIYLSLFSHFLFLRFP